MARKNKYTWQMVEEEYGVDFEQIYFRRISGEAWHNLCNVISREYVVRLTRDWCEENGYDPDSTNKEKICHGIIKDVKCVDKGKVTALNNAGWKVFDIAIDCHCTEECVHEILEGIGNGKTN